VLVDRRRRDALVDAVGRSLVRFFGDDPRQSPHFGRIVNRRHFDRVSAYLG
jgi:aldehyde dehydrogenase (NAD+)